MMLPELRGSAHRVEHDRWCFIFEGGQVALVDDQGSILLRGFMSYGRPKMVLGKDPRTDKVITLETLQ